MSTPIGPMDKFVVAGSQGGDHFLRAFNLDHGPDLASEVDPPTALLHGFRLQPRLLLPLAATISPY
jgi:hypothetical protein